MASPRKPSTAFQPPPGSTTITVKLINPVNFGPSILNRFMAPPVPHLETFKDCPSLSFLLEHPSGRRLIWDLGIRKDYQNYAPSIANYIPTTNYTFDVTQNVADILIEGGINLSSVEAIIWSHWHWDHIGDPSTFPASTDLVVGPGFKEGLLPGAPANPTAPIQESDYEGRTLREISFEDSSLKIGRFSAYDYFGDGSFYLLDSPGHAVGHLCGLARTTTSSEDTFILLGGDVCHYAGIFRPSKYLPVPQEIKPHPFASQRFQGDSIGLCPGAAWDKLQASRGRVSTDTLFDMTFGLDIPLATDTMHKLQELDCTDNVFVVIAHDSTVRDHAPHFPATLNDWKAKGLGSDLKWAWMRDLEAHFKSQESSP